MQIIVTYTDDTIEKFSSFRDAEAGIYERVVGGNLEVGVHDVKVVGGPDAGAEYAVKWIHPRIVKL